MLGSDRPPPAEANVPDTVGVGLFCALTFYVIAPETLLNGFKSHPSSTRVCA